MSHALVTIIAPIRQDRLPDAERLIDALGNPARLDIATVLDELVEGDGTHFTSLHAVRSQDGARAHLVFEFSADGTEDEALPRIADAIGDRLRPIFMLATDWSDGGELLAYLRHHRVKVGAGWFANPGAAFAGTPGMTVGRIRDEAKLAARASELLEHQPGHLTALERVEQVRSELASDLEFKSALTPALAQPPYEPPPTVNLIGQLVVSFAATYLWPIGLVLLAWAVYRGVSHAQAQAGHVVADWLNAFASGAARGLWTGFWVALLLVLVIAGGGYLLLRRAEKRDALEERAPDRAILTAMFERENRLTQNHMISVTQRKPGIIRWFTSRLVFWAVGQFVTRLYRPGFLGDIGTIHFARWVTAPHSPDLIFLSNYDASWESYLEDFITRAHTGLTAIWSNSIGFPRSENLIEKGATDGERFKRYARHSMVPTRFWHSAYPTLTTAAIRTNAEIRRGLSGTMTEDEAALWLAQFGSAARPVSKLVTNEIQSLIFGGLKFMPHGMCLLFELSDNRTAARNWLAAVSPHIAFGDGRLHGTVVTLALGAGGLARLGLPPEGLATFPFAFLEGMTTEARARILGDQGSNAAEHWLWGRAQPDAALLIYGGSGKAVAHLEERLTGLATQHGLALPFRIPLKTIDREDKTEPFGFVDGISQPVIRGTYKGTRNADPIHLVEPGEFILGYPDNRGNLPPGPTLPATADPANQLPLVGQPDNFSRAVVDTDRDLGRNGSFLVIRQLEQDVSGFENYCAVEAKRLENRLSPPYEMSADFIAAKLIGRWKDGSSLARHPYEPPIKTVKRHAALETPAETARHTAMDAHPPAEEHGVTIRPETNPAAATPIHPPPQPSFRADNDFLFGSEDPEAVRCPFGAHIRRANPRDSFDPGSADQIAITNRHRIIRVGRQYEPMEGRNPGLLFMCLNGDIERQFEFVQQTWLRNPSFHGLSCEKDPLLGDGEAGVCGFTTPTREGPIRLSPLPPFVTTRGGGYFFLPGKRLIEYLAAAR